MRRIIKKLLGGDFLIRIKTWLAFKDNQNLKNELGQNALLKDRYIGKRCFIIGNGPSIKNIDFSKLSNEYTFSVNQLSRNPQFEKLHTNFHVWADERFFHIDEDSPEDLELLDVMKKVNTVDNKPIVFYKYKAYEMIQKFKLDEVLDIHYFEETYLDRYMINSWNLDFTRLVPGFSTVVHYIICLAMYMGFKEIILLGCDCTGIVSIAESRIGQAEKAAYGYSISKNEKKRMEKMQDLTSFRDEMQWWVNIFDDYSILDKYCIEHGVKLLNATNPTLLENVTRIELDNVLADV